MNPHQEFLKIIRATKILKSPKRRLATFGQTSIPYFFISEVKGFRDRSRMREGLVVAENPKLITPELLRDRFEGFGKDSAEFGRWLSRQYGQAFQGLLYRFRNEGVSTRLEYAACPLLGEQMQKRFQSDRYDSCALIRGPDRGWQISLMKFIVDECLAAFAGNLKELDEHGYFDSPEKTQKERRREIEKLFARARGDRSALPLLEQRLRQSGLWKEYEDRFLRFFSD